MIGVVSGEASAKKFQTAYDGIIDVVAKKYDLPSDLIHSIIRTESNYNSHAVSRKGAKGLMQLMPTTARIYGVKDVFDPVQNIEGGVKYLNDLVKLYKKNTKRVLAAYNAGQEAVKKYGGIPPYPETKNYIKKVMSIYTLSTIRTKTIIYQYYDESGRLVLTNSEYLYSRHKKNKK
jgi:soluble lytic murein transglycosylase-like protein